MGGVFLRHFLHSASITYFFMSFYIHTLDDIFITQQGTATIISPKTNVHRHTRIPLLAIQQI